eukprot:jgi/Botrbrau1/15928/Bobra.0253s0003.1
MMRLALRMSQDLFAPLPWAPTFLVCQAKVLDMIASYSSAMIALYSSAVAVARKRHSTGSKHLAYGPLGNKSSCRRLSEAPLCKFVVEEFKKLASMSLRGPRV